MEENVTLVSQGLKLRGLLHKPEGEGPFPMVILLHGFCDDRNEINFVHTDLSRRLCKDGIASVRFDFAGSGESEGLFEEMTISNELQDTLNILDWVKTLPFVDTSRIGLHGTSLGGCVASMAAGLRPDEIAALSLWCPAPDLVYNLKNFNLCGLDVSDVKETGLMDVEGLPCSLTFYEDALQLDPYQMASAYEGPVSLVHGLEDITASPDCSRRYKEIYGDQASLLLVEGAEHRFKSFAWRKARMDAAEKLFIRHLLGKEE